MIDTKFRARFSRRDFFIWTRLYRSSFRITKIALYRICCVKIGFFSNSKVLGVNVRIFNWIIDKLIKFEKENSSNLKKFKTFVLSRITDLLKLNVEKSREIIDIFGSNEEKNIINQMSDQPQLQLKYLQNKIKEEREKNQYIENDLLLLHIELLCKIAPD